MDITLTQSNLNHALSQIMPAIRPHGSLPVLEHVLLQTNKGKLDLSSTNLEIGITTSIGAKVDVEGAISLPAKTLYEFIASNSDETVRIKVDKNSALITSDHFEAKLAGLDAEEFPPLPPLDSKTKIKLPTKVFLQALDRVVFASGLDDTRPVLTGVYIKVSEKLATIVATDSFRLAEIVIELKDSYPEQSVIIPAKTLLDLKRMIGPSDETIDLSLDDNQVAIEYATTKIISRLVDGQYPDYQQIIPKQTPNKVVVSRVKLLQALKMSAIFAREVAGTIKLKLNTDSDKIELEAISPQSGSSKALIEAKYSGAPLEISFNAKYISDVLAVLDADDITLEFNDSSTPVIITQSELPYLYLVMPLKES